MIYRIASEADLPSLTTLAEQAKEYFRSNHINQWQKGEPNEQGLAAAISEGKVHVLDEDGRVLAMITLQEGDELSYRQIDGAWLNDLPYMAFHRVCVDSSLKGRGLAAALFEHSEQIALSRGYSTVRIDTHPDNLSMQRALAKSGYRTCGRIALAEGSEKGDPRIGYQKLLRSS